MFTAHVVPFRAHLAPFYRPWYDNVVLLWSCRTGFDVGTDWRGRLTPVRQYDNNKIGTTKNGVNNRTHAQRRLQGLYRSDRHKKGGAIVHREAETFDRKQAANAWIVKREPELKRPGGPEQKEDPTLAAVIDRYIAESNNAVLGTKAQVLKTIKNSDLGDIKCSDLTSNTLVSFARELSKNVEPQTCGNYFSHLSNIFTVARPAWGYPLSRRSITGVAGLRLSVMADTGRRG